jgi:6-phosphogluconolactonase (cycloisomerase 2 family)
MSKRFAWLFGVMILVAIGLLVACGDKYNSASDGLVLVSSQGSGLLESFSFSLNSGSIFAVNNPPGDTSNDVCVLNGIPSGIVVDPAGTYAYTIITANVPACGSGSTVTGIAAFRVNSSGTMTAVGSIVPDPNPTQLVMDSTGKFLFVAEGLSTTSIANANVPQAKTPCVQNNTQYGVCVYAIGSGATLTAVPATFTFALPPESGFQAPNFAAVAATPMVLPGLVNGVQQGVCSSQASNPLTAEYLYAADSVNNVVWEFLVDTSTGALGNPPGTQSVQPPQGSSLQPPSTGSTPSGITVDACDRFVYVANNLSNNVSAYTICNGGPSQGSNCPAQDGSLQPVSGSPFSLTGGANGPGPMMTDPFGNYLYVLNLLSNQISTFHISPVAGTLAAGNPAIVATGNQPKSMAIRADDNWLFVANFQAATLSQYSVTPATGALTPLPATTTDNYPWGVAVK